jgi:tetratricopeptide (TPR) repeat protein
MSASGWMCVRRVFFLLLLILSLVQPRAADSATLRGRLTLAPTQGNKNIEVVLKKGRLIVSRVIPDAEQDYEFKNLANGRYELAIKVDKQEVRRQINLCCGPDSISVIDISLDRSVPSIAVSFPVEAPDIVDVVELRRDFPKSILKEYEKARTDMQVGNLERAVERLRRVLKSAPDFYGARARLGMLYHNMACYLDAEREYVRARELNPRAAQPLMNLGSVYLEAAGARLDGDRRYLDEAIAILKEAILIRPNSTIGHCLLGMAYFKNQSYEAAEETLRKALGMDKRFGAARLMLANVCMRQERWKEAIEHIDVYLEEHPFSPDRGKIRSLREEIVVNLKPASQ